MKLKQRLTRSLLLVCQQMLLAPLLLLWQPAWLLRRPQTWPSALCHALLTCWLCVT